MSVWEVEVERDWGGERAGCLVGVSFETLIVPINWFFFLGFVGIGLGVNLKFVGICDCEGRIDWKE